MPDSVPSVLFAAAFQAAVPRQLKSDSESIHGSQFPCIRHRFGVIWRRFEWRCLAKRRIGPRPDFKTGERVFDQRSLLVYVRWLQNFLSSSVNSGVPHIAAGTDFFTEVNLNLFLSSSLPQDKEW